MSVIGLIKRLERTFGVKVGSVKVLPNRAACTYDWATGNITICTYNRPKDEITFSVLHEYRHAIQFASNMFPEVKGMDPKTFPQDHTYWELPWEKDANDWALETGFRLGLFSPGFKPWWLEVV